MGAEGTGKDLQTVEEDVDVKTQNNAQATNPHPIFTDRNDESNFGLESLSPREHMMEQGRRLREQRKSVSLSSTSFVELRAQYMNANRPPLDAEVEEDSEDEEDSDNSQDKNKNASNEKTGLGSDLSQNVTAIGIPKIKEKKKEIQATKSQYNDPNAKGSQENIRNKGKSVSLVSPSNINHRQNTSISINENIENTNNRNGKATIGNGVLSRTKIFSFLDHYNPVANFLDKLKTPKKDRTVSESSKPISAKLYFANERTFLSWMQMCLILGGLAVGLLNFGDKFSQASGLVFSVITSGFMFYALIQFHARADMIRTRIRGREYEDLIGALALIISVLLSISINLVLTVLLDS